MENSTLQLYPESPAHLKMSLLPVFPQNIQVVPQVISGTNTEISGTVMFNLSANIFILPKKIKV